MPLRTGRLEKRYEVRLPVQLSSLHDPGATERATTENVSARGVRVLTKHPLRPDERLFINSPGGELRAQARVVYCQALTGERFGVGLQLQEVSASWKMKLGGLSD